MRRSSLPNTLNDAKSKYMKNLDSLIFRIGCVIGHPIQPQPNIIKPRNGANVLKFLRFLQLKLNLIGLNISNIEIN